MVRIQANLGYLAGQADASKAGAPPKLDAFPASPHCPDSTLPALYEQAIALFAARAVAVAGTKRPATESPEGQGQAAGQRKRVSLSAAPPIPTPPAAPPNPQAAALLQAFGPNALGNLHALQTHAKGQGTHPWVAFMEANVPNFKSLPIQMQLQQMTGMQNAVARQRTQSQGQEPPGSG